MKNQAGEVGLVPLSKLKVIDKSRKHLEEARRTVPPAEDDQARETEETAGEQLETSTEPRAHGKKRVNYFRLQSTLFSSI